MREGGNGRSGGLNGSKRPFEREGSFQFFSESIFWKKTERRGLRFDGIEGEDGGDTLRGP